MEYTKIELDNFNIHLIKTNKFKKTVLKINFKNELIEEDILKRKLIPGILLESNKKYKTRRMLNIKEEELYGLSVSVGTTISGKTIISYLTASFLNDTYVPGLFKDVFEYVSNLILNPNIKDGKFDANALKYAKQVILEEIALSNEDPSFYAVEELYKHLGRKTPLSYSSFGLASKLSKINSKELYEYYKYMRKNDNVDIFICGNVNDDVIDVIKSNFKINNIKTKYDHYISFTEYATKPKKIKEAKSYNQSTLLLGYRMDKLTKYERLYVLPIYSYILGGGPDSKLFKNVREKNSLCYSISASFKTVSNVMVIKSGINASSYNKAIKLIEEEVDKLNGGGFNKSDIDKAKITYINAFEEVYDTPSAVMNDYISKEYLDTDLVYVRKRMIKKVTKKDIMKIIPKIHFDTIYFLEGSLEK